MLPHTLQKPQRQEEGPESAPGQHFTLLMLQAVTGTVISRVALAKLPPQLLVVLHRTSGNQRGE